jgi:hypothetical protein
VKEKMAADELGGKGDFVVGLWISPVLAKRRVVKPLELTRKKQKDAL